MSFEASAKTEVRVHARDEFGQFASLLERAKTSTLDELATLGRNKAIEFAPRGNKPDKRTPRIIDSMYKIVGFNSVRWGTTARHAMPQETGSRRHPITGRVRFWWENAPAGARMWVPGDNVIDHPGNPATHFLSRSIDWVMANAIRIADKHYPG